MSWRAQGMRTWLVQRITAFYMLMFSIFLLAYFVMLAPVTYSEWKMLFAHPVMNISSMLFFMSLLYHAWIGIRDILIDYVHWAPLRLTIWILVTTGLIAMGVWVLMILYAVVKL